MINQGDATIGITVASGGATVLALTATQVISRVWITELNNSEKVVTFS